MHESFHNPILYRELCVPFESADKANEAVAEFQKELYELRKKHRIADLLFVAQIPLKYEDGEEGTPIIMGMFGDENKMESLAAYAFGRSSAERQQRVNSLSEHAAKALRGMRSGK